MTDPLRWLFGILFGRPWLFPQLFEETPIVINGLIVLMGVLTVKGILGVSTTKEEQRWVAIHGDIIRRIERLMPVYRNTNLMFIQYQMGALTNNRRVVKCMRSIKDGVKQRAEVDFVMHDADRPENIAVLQEQLTKATEVTR